MTLELFTAEKIAELAFGAVIETGTSELVKKLWGKIRNQLRGEPVAEAALVEIEQNHSKEQLAKIVPFLQVEMLKDQQFAQEMQALANEINTGSQENITQQDFEARDNAGVVGKQVGTVNKAGVTEIGIQFNLGKE
ncbi:MAG: hypothetical protein F6J89_31025 [Symploca sp. SIO1C4]|uniref:Uncharacterized protein n=1 Tax=Symploca sp. SIO1C4 TaxID=2607765 RepID=A0A6B3NJI2_9CYAN|nr:hypothetical protein [Symploca sp. SIO1C4]